MKYINNSVPVRNLAEQLLAASQKISVDFGPIGLAPLLEILNLSQSEQKRLWVLPHQWLELGSASNRVNLGERHGVDIHQARMLELPICIVLRAQALKPKLQASSKPEALATEMPTLLPIYLSPGIFSALKSQALKIQNHAVKGGETNKPAAMQLDVTPWFELVKSGFSDLDASQRQATMDSLVTLLGAAAHYSHARRVKALADDYDATLYGSFTTHTLALDPNVAQYSRVYLGHFIDDLFEKALHNWIAKVGTGGNITSKAKTNKNKVERVMT